MAEVWSTWEGRVINGLFPLRRLLGSSDHSGVFLTEYKTRGSEDVAIKLVQVDAAGTKTQLSHWQSATALAHPHLIQLYETGRCQVDDRSFLFVLMEYADQTLAQLLPQRALTAQEVRELLPPTLDALSFLHHRDLVHCRLKPTNLLVVHDRVKLASDTIRPAGQSTAIIDRSSAYDSPEAKRGRISPAGDLWSLGMTLTEALTQALPSWPDEASDAVSLPQTTPADFIDPIRHCLNRNPAKRPTLAELETELKLPPRVSGPTPAIAAAEPASSPAGLPLQRLLVPGAAALIALLLVAWAGLHFFQSHHERPAAVTALPASPSPQASSATVPEPTPPPAPASAPAPRAADSAPRASDSAPRASDSASPPLPGEAADVVHEEIPDVPRSARDTIHGRIKVLVHVTVDSGGNVVDQTLTFAGPSKYFARLSTEAASKWKFAPTDSQDLRPRLLHFEFSRGGTTGHATVPRS